MTENQLKELLNDMTLKEKIGQLMQLDSSCFQDAAPVTGPANDLGVDKDDFMLAGSVLGLIGAEETKKLQETYMESHPHHIPLIFMADIINGYRTVFPIPLALGCSFEPKAAQSVGSIMAQESAAAGLHVTFAPMVDLVRDARWGRVMESTGEDPYLNSVMAEAFVCGIQGENEDYSGHLGACTKHFAAYGAPMGGREYNNVELSQRTLREDYFPSYAAAIRAKSAMVMTAFQTLDRIPASGNQWLMKDVLRDEMGFDGVLVSDWNAIGELVTHGTAVDKCEAAKQAIEAGVDMDMMSGAYMAELEGLAASGEIKEEMIDQAVFRVLELKNRMGLFEHPYRNAGEDLEKKLLLKKESREEAKRIAADSMVLLKNENAFLPLSTKEEAAFIGPYADEKNILGAWSFFADIDDSVTIKEGVLQKTSAAEFEQGCGMLNPGQTIYGFRYHVTNEMTDEETKEMIASAVELAKNKKKVILALGESNLMSGEGGSRGDITIPDIQKKLLDEVYQVNENIGVVLFAGRPMDIRDITGKAKSILYAWMPGTEGGNAIADILYGDVVPQAKLSMSFPYSVGQVPVFYGEFKTGRHVEDGENKKDRFLSRYIDIPNQPLYPFGYGLSYTTFSCSKIHLDKNRIGMEEELKAEVVIENTGSRSGTETIQLYITDECASVARPVRELKGIQKVTLLPGEKENVSFTIHSDMLRFYDRDMQYKAEKGRFILWIGTDSMTENCVEFELDM